MLVDGYLESRADNPMTAMITGFNTTGREQSINSFRAMVQSINLPIVIAWDNDKQKVSGWHLLIQFLLKEIRIKISFLWAKPDGVTQT